MRCFYAVALVMFCFSHSLAQDSKQRNLGLNGVEFSFNVLNTPEGKDFGYFMQSTRWQSAADGTTIVYVCWENHQPELQREHQLVKDAVTATWQAHSKLEFRGWQPCGERSSGIRIFLSEEGPHTKGLGHDLDGKPQGMVLNFTFNSWSSLCKKTPLECIKSIAVHEFGHAIGFAHEQNRPDKPGECRQPAQGVSAGAVMLTPYDPRSVMNYCNVEYNNNGQLSNLDIVALQKIYGVNQ